MSAHHLSHLVFKARLREADSGALVDTPALLSRCFEADWQQTKVRRFIRSNEERSRIKQFLRSVYPILREAFRFYCCLSGKFPRAFLTRSFPVLAHALADASRCSKRKAVRSMRVCTHDSFALAD